MEDSKEIAYLILQEKYLQLNGYNTNENIDIIKLSKILPNNWDKIYNIDDKIKYISIAINSKKNLIDVINDEQSKIL